MSKEMALLPETLSSRDFYTIIIESIKHSVIALNKEGKILFLNGAMENLFRIPRASILGKSFGSVFKLGKQREKRILRAMREGLELKNREISMACPDGKKRVFIFNTTMVRDDKARINGAVVVLEDVTDLRRYEKEVAKAELLAAVSELAAGTAHEIRNPLTSVKGFVQLLGSRFPAGATEHSYLEIMLEELDKVNRIISNFLMLVKPDPGELRLTCLNYLVQDVLILLQGQAAMQGVKISGNCGDLPLCLIQPDQVRMVILNIARNSLQAMPQGGDLNIETALISEGTLIEVRISDTGEGIPPENLGKIVVPFFSTREEGSGLGLTVAHRIVQNHGGKLEAQSTAGCGTKITVRLPVNADLKGIAYS